MKEFDRNLYKVGIIGHGFVGEALHYGLEQKIPGLSICFHDPAKKGSVSIRKLVRNANIIFVCVPTPTDFSTGKQDISIIENVVDKIVKLSSPGKKVIVIKSTILPGTINKLQKKHPAYVFLHNPEFLTEANFKDDFLNQDRIVIGGTVGSHKLVDLYRMGWPDIPIYTMYPIEAEMVKYVANCFLALKVAYFNNIYDLAWKVGANYYALIKAVVADHRIGKSHFMVPGQDKQRGFGGRCFPKDLLSFYKLFGDLGINNQTLWAALDVNEKVREKKDWFDIKGATTDY